MRVFFKFAAFSVMTLLLSQHLLVYVGFPGGSVVKNPPASAGERHGLDAWLGKIPWRRKWQPTPVFLSGESHGQRSLVGYSPQGHKRTGHASAIKQKQGTSAAIGNYKQETLNS